MRRPEPTAAFSLMELLAVILVIGILAAIAIPTFFGQRKSVQGKADITELEAAAQAIGSYGQRAGSFALLDTAKAAALYPDATWVSVAPTLNTQTLVSVDLAATGGAQIPATAAIPNGQLCATTATKCVILRRCRLSYFKSGASLCMTVRSEPFGDGSDTRARVTRTLDCSPAATCAANLWNAAGGTSTPTQKWGSLGAASSDWPSLPSAGAA